MIRSDQIQAAIVQHLKGVTAVTNELNIDGSYADEIREDTWQGSEFIYPCIRVRMMPLTPDSNPACGNRSNFECSIMVFTETDSSLRCDTIAGIIAGELHGHSYSSVGVHLWMTVTSLIPAMRVSSRTWRAEVLLSGGASLVV